MDLTQLSFNIAPRLIGSEPAEVRAGALAIKGDLGVDVNLEHGDELLVTVTGPDGEVLARHHAEVSAPPSFVPIEDKDLGLIGYVRAHKVKVGEPA
jgi:hypothetical protein